MYIVQSCKEQGVCEEDMSEGTNTEKGYPLRLYSHLRSSLRVTDEWSPSYILEILFKTCSTAALSPHTQFQTTLQKIIFHSTMT